MKIIVRVDALSVCDAADYSDVSRRLRSMLVESPREGPPVLVEGELGEKDLPLAIRPPKPWEGERVQISFNNGSFMVFVPVPAIREIIIQP